jgi:hypothetical protein
MKAMKIKIAFFINSYFSYLLLSLFGWRRPAVCLAGCRDSPGLKSSLKIRTFKK